MKSIISIYNESLIDSDTEVKLAGKRALLNYEELDKYFKDNPVLGINIGRFNRNYSINEDGSIHISKDYYHDSKEIVFEHDLPSYIKISFIDPCFERVRIDNGVTTLEFLPQVLEQELYINNCKTLKQINQVKQVKSLFIVNSELSTLRGLPKATKFIRFKNSGSWDEAQISKFSGISKSKITVFK